MASEGARGQFGACRPKSAEQALSEIVRDVYHRRSMYTVTGQNGSGQNGTDKMVWTKCYTDKMVLDKMIWTKWYGQNGTMLYFMYVSIQFNSIYI